MLNCKAEVAQSIIDAIMNKYKVYADWMKSVIQETRRTGVSWVSWDGEPAIRRPLFRVADSYDDEARKTAERGSFNSPVQGLSAFFQLQV